MRIHALPSLSARLVLGLALVASSTAPGSAGDTFLCRDGSSIVIDDDNRADMQEHPCVKAWFADDLALRRTEVEQGAAGQVPDAQPVVHRYTLRRAVALRDLQQRPAYLAWSRTRPAQVRSATRTNGTVVGGSPPSPRLGVTIQVPAGLQ